MPIRIVTMMVAGVALMLGSIVPAYADTSLSEKVLRLNNQKPQSRAAAVQEIVRSGNSAEAGKALAGRLPAEKDPRVRAQIAGALGTMQSRESVNDLIKLAKEDESAEVRAVSCISLGSLGDSAAIAALKDIMQNETEDDNVRISAAGALTRYLSGSGVAAALETIMKGNNTILKLGLVNSLRGSLKSPVARSLLDTGAKDSDESVRAMSQELLAVKQ